MAYWLNWLKHWYIDLQAIFKTLNFTNNFSCIFIVCVYVEQNLLFKNTETYFTSAWFGLEWHGVTVLKVLAIFV